MRDEGLRSSCFNSLTVLCAQFGEDVPYVGDLDRGFAFRGQRVPFLNRQQGIFRAAAQGGPAVLSIQTSVNGPYDDRETPDGVLYAYRGTDPSHRDNRAMRAAFELGTPGAMRGPLDEQEPARIRTRSSVAPSCVRRTSESIRRGSAVVSCRPTAINALSVGSRRHDCSMPPTSSATSRHTGKQR